MVTVNSQGTYIGITVLAEAGRGRKRYNYASLDRDLKLLAIGEGDLDEVLAYASGQTETRVAINAPRRPNQGLMHREEVRQGLVPPPGSVSWYEYRVAEYQLRQYNIHILPTPNRTKSCSPWIQSGFDLFLHLEEMGFLPYPDPEALRQLLEVHCQAVFCALLELAPFPRECLEGRLQRQLILFERGVKISDPMDFFEEVTTFKLLRGLLPLKEIYTPGELDALASAYTAWMAATKPGEVTILGAAEEGQIVIPARVLKEKY
jgi:hypothetical protein